MIETARQAGASTNSQAREVRLSAFVRAKQSSQNCNSDWTRSVVKYSDRPSAEERKTEGVGVFFGQQSIHVVYGLAEKDSRPSDPSSIVVATVARRWIFHALASVATELNATVIPWPMAIPQNS